MFDAANWGYPPVAYVGVGSDPFGVAVDNATNETYVTNSGSDNVTVISADTYQIVTSIAVGSSPYGIAYDAETGDLYVANGGSANVSVISGSSHAVIASVPVGTSPTGVAVDPTTGQVFVANEGSNNVTVISDSTNSVITGIGTGLEPYGVALDNDTGAIYVTNQGSNNLTVIATANDKVIATIPVVAPASQLQGIAYDSGSHQLWVGAGAYTAVVVNATTNAVAYSLTVDPSGVAYDPDTGDICVTNTLNSTLECILPADWLGSYNSAVSLDFEETGLPAGTAWSATVNGSGWMATTTTTQFSLSDVVSFAMPVQGGDYAQYSYSIASANGYLANPHAGSLSFNQTPMQINVTFSPPAGTFVVNFSESGLPAGTTWGVDFAGIHGSSSATSITFAEPNGSYNFSVDPVVGFVPVPSTGTVSVAGGAVGLQILFVPGTPPPTVHTVTFTETGLAVGTIWTVGIDGNYHSSSTSAIPVSLENGTYGYTIAAVSGYAVSGAVSGSLVVNSSLSVAVVFVPVYTVDFIESGLPAGTIWTVTLGDQSGSEAGSVIGFTVFNGTYSFSIGPVSAYGASPHAGTLNVSSDQFIPVAFSLLIGPPPAPVSYAATFQALGLPQGSSWSVSVDQTPQDTAGPSTTFNLTNGTHVFVVVPPSGYLATPTSGTFQVTGGPVNLTVVFSANSAAGTSTGTGFSVLVLGLGIVGGLAIGAIAGVLVAMIVVRRRPRSPG